MNELLAVCEQEQKLQQQLANKAQWRDDGTGDLPDQICVDMHDAEGIKQEPQSDGNPSVKNLPYQSEESNKTSRATTTSSVSRTYVEVHKCDNCSQMFLSSAAAEIHNCVKHVSRGKDGSYVCQVCQETFVSLEGYQKHSLLHTSTAPMESNGKIQEAAQKAVKKRSVPMKKQNESASLKQRVLHQCVSCPEEFTSNAALRRHTKHLHPVTPKELVDIRDLQPPDATHGSVNQEEDTDSKVAPAEDSISEPTKADGSKKKRVSADGRTFPCTGCSKNFRSKYLLNKHNCAGTSERIDQVTFTCQICMKVYHQQRSYEKHSLTHSTVRKHECALCSEPCSSDESLAKHLMDLHPRVSTLKQEGKATADGAVSTATDLMPVIHICDVCKKGFKLRCHLNRHMAIHTSDPKPHQCPYCEKRFARTDAVRRHAVSMHPDKESVPRDSGKREKQLELKAPKLKSQENVKSRGTKTLTCEHCGREFNTNGHLRRHVLVHVGKAYKCPHCEKSFHRADTLKRHYVVMHHPDLRYNATADQLTKAVSQLVLPSVEEVLVLNGLVPPRNPKPIQEGEQYQCFQCPEKFQWPSALKKHLKKHEVPRQFMCDICGRCFLRKKALRYHLADHENSICMKDDDDSMSSKMKSTCSYMCQTCGRVFLSAYKLQRHAVTHSRKRLFRCEVCDGRYTRADTLKRHRECMHDLFDDNTEEKPAGSTAPGPDGTYTMRNVKRQHMRVDHREILTCPVCQKICRGKTHLHEHKKTHGTKRLPCPVCRRRFKTEMGLRSHISIHTAYVAATKDYLPPSEDPVIVIPDGGTMEPSPPPPMPPTTPPIVPLPYVCPQCNQSFISSTHLRRHQTTLHLNNRAYNCHLCYKVFTRREVLKCHMKRHAQKLGKMDNTKIIGSSTADAHSTSSAGDVWTSSVLYSSQKSQVLPLEGHVTEHIPFKQHPQAKVIDHRHSAQNKGISILKASPMPESSTTPGIRANNVPANQMQTQYLTQLCTVSKQVTIVPTIQSIPQTLPQTVPEAVPQTASQTAPQIVESSGTFGHVYPTDPDRSRDVDTPHQDIYSTNMEVYGPDMGRHAVANPAIVNPTMDNPSITNPTMADTAMANLAMANSELNVQRMAQQVADSALTHSRQPPPAHALPTIHTPQSQGFHTGTSVIVTSSSPLTAINFQNTLPTVSAPAMNTAENRSDVSYTENTFASPHQDRNPIPTPPTPILEQPTSTDFLPSQTPPVLSRQMPSQQLADDPAILIEEKSNSFYLHQQSGSLMFSTSKLSNVSLPAHVIQNQLPRSSLGVSASSIILPTASADTRPLDISLNCGHQVHEPLSLSTSSLGLSSASVSRIATLNPISVSLSGTVAQTTNNQFAKNITTNRQKQYIVTSALPDGMSISNVPMSTSALPDGITNSNVQIATSALPDVMSTSNVQISTSALPDGMTASNVQIASSALPDGITDSNVGISTSALPDGITNSNVHITRSALPDSITNSNVGITNSELPDDIVDSNTEISTIPTLPDGIAATNICSIANYNIPNLGAVPQMSLPSIALPNITLPQVSLPILPTLQSDTLSKLIPSLSNLALPTQSEAMSSLMNRTQNEISKGSLMDDGLLTSAAAPQDILQTSEPELSQEYRLQNKKDDMEL